MDKSNLKSPGGMRSFLPDMAMELRDIQSKIEKIFTIWGYQPVITPTLEYYDSLTLGMGRKMNKELYKFIDYEGNILALRPEMTAPIARTVAGRLGDINLPVRYSYNAPVFRYDEPQTGKNREIYQMGVEFIGDESYSADAEAVILAIEALLNTGIKEFKIDIGHAGYLDGIINKLEFEEDRKKEIRRYLNRKDIVGLQNHLDRLGSRDKGVLSRLPLLRGDKEVLKLAREMADNPQSLKAVNNLQKVFNYIVDYGFEDYLNFDLGLIRGFDYYTGIVFEGFTEKLGYTICGGGRYDNLIGQYANGKIPAIGFAVGVERIRLALRRQSHQFSVQNVDEFVVFTGENRSFALKLVKKLRKKGLTTISIEKEQLDDKLISSAKEMKLRRIIDLTKETDSIEVLELDKKRKSLIKVEKGWEEKIWQY